MNDFYARLLGGVFGAAVVVEVIAVLAAANSDGTIKALAIPLAVGVALVLVIGILWVGLAFLGAAALVGLITLLSRGDQPNGNPGAGRAPHLSHRERRRRRTVTWD